MPQLLSQHKNPHFIPLSTSDPRIDLLFEYKLDVSHSLSCARLAPQCFASLAGFNGFRLSSKRNCKFKLDSIKARTSGATYNKIAQSNAQAKDYLETSGRVQAAYIDFYQSETAKKILFYRNAVFGGLAALTGGVSSIVFVVLEILCQTGDPAKHTGEHVDGLDDRDGMVKEGVNAACQLWNKVTGRNKKSFRFWAGKSLQGLVW